MSIDSTKVGCESEALKRYSGRFHACHVINTAVFAVGITLLSASGVNVPAFAHYELAADCADAQANKTAKTKNKKQIKAEQNFDPWKLLEMAISPAYAYVNNVKITIEGSYRVVHSDGIPDHATGAFPNAGNPNTISEQTYDFRMPKDPQLSGYTSPLGMNLFGVAINGVPFDPGAAEWWDNDRSSGWQYEAMALGPRLGLDQNNAHVQPNGAYHYHGPPTGLLDRLAQYSKPVLIGYAADGFPIYGPYGYRDAKNSQSGLAKLSASYRIKSGTRRDGPGGRYDGSFIEDYEYVAGLGNLDDSNGRYGVTPEYPNGTYYYVITYNYPYIPRSFKGTPDSSFQHHPGAGRGMRGGPGGFNGRPGFGRGPQNEGPPPFGRGPRGGYGGGSSGPPDGGFGPPPGRPPFDQ